MSRPLVLALAVLAGSVGSAFAASPARLNTPADRASLMSMPNVAPAQELPLAYRGSGQRAGGPAYLLISSTGGAVQPVRPRNPETPLAYRGSGQRAGGPAYLLIGSTGGAIQPARPRNPQIPLAYRGSGNRAGGPAYLLNQGGR